MVRVRINAGRITDWESFYRVFREAMDFPASYGEDMDSWGECMLHPGVLTQFPVTTGGVLVLEVAKPMGFRGRCPELFAALLEATTYVNLRFIAEGQPPPLALLFV